jgi:hypothetical protein
MSTQTQYGRKKHRVVLGLSEAHEVTTSGKWVKATDRPTIRRLEAVVGFAPCRPEQRVCLHPTGRWAGQHWGDKEGRCVFCGRVER